MADTISIMNKGRLEQVGTPKEIYDKPKRKFVADFIGETNLLPCQLVDEKNRKAVVSSNGLNITTLRIEGISLNDEAFISIRPDRIRIGYTKGLNNIYSALIKNKIFHGADIRFIVETENGQILNLVTTRTDEYEKFVVGQETNIGWNTEDSILVRM